MCTGSGKLRPLFVQSVRRGWFRAPAIGIKPLRVKATGEARAPAEEHGGGSRETAGCALAPFGSLAPQQVNPGPAQIGLKGTGSLEQTIREP